MVLHGFVANIQYSIAIVIHILSYWYLLFKLELLSQEMGGRGTIFFKGGPYFSEKSGLGGPILLK